MIYSKIMENDSEIRVNIRTGTSTQTANPRIQTRNIISNQLPIQYGPISFEIISYDRPLMTSDFNDTNIINRVLERSFHDTSLRRNPVVQLDLNSHTCRTSEIDDECSICSLKFALGDKLTTIESCNHSFHFSCLEEWGRYKQECPLCRNTIPILER